MSGNIKGITIEFGGNATPLEKALKDINGQSKKTQSELTKVNKLLKLDPSNTVLQKQKQELLTKEIGNTSTKLKALKDAEVQVNEAFKNGEVSEEQVRDLQREIVKTDDKLKTLKKEQIEFNASVSKLGQASTKLDNFSKKTTTAGQNLSSLSLVIAGLAAGAVVAFDEVDEGMDKIIESTGATGDAAKDLENVYNYVTSKIAGDFTSLGSGIAEIYKRFNLTGKELKKSSVLFAEFARITDTDMTEAVQLVARAMGDAGIKSKDYNKVLDALTVAYQKSGIAVSTLAEDITKYGAPMRALGFNTKTSIALFASWEKAGVNTSIAFSGMKKAISNFAKAGKDSRVEFAKTLKDIKSAPTLAEATTKAIEIFGAKAGPDLADAIYEGRFSIDEMISALDKSDGAVKKTYNNIVDEADAAKVTVQASKKALAQVGYTLLSSLSPAIKGATKDLDKFTEWWAKLPKSIQKTITVTGLAAGAAGPALITLGRVASGLSVITGRLSKLKEKEAAADVSVGTSTSMFSKLWGVLRAHPMVAVGIAAGALAFQIARVTIAGGEANLEYNKLHKTMQASVQDAKDESASNLVLWQRLKKLNSIHDKTNSQKAEESGIVKILNSRIDGLNLKYDEEKDALSDSTDAIYDNIQAMKDQALAAAYEAAMEKIQKSIASNSVKLAKAKQAEKKAEDELTAARERGVKGRGLSSYESKVATAKAKVKDLQTTIDKSENDLDSYGKSFSLQSTIAEFDKLVQKAKLSGSDIPKALRSGIESGKISIPESVKALKATIKFYDLAEKAKIDGKKIPAALASAVASGKISVQTAMSRLKKWIVIKDVAAKMGIDSKDIPKNIKNGILSGKTSVKDATKALKKEANKGMESSGNDGKQRGKEYVKGYTNSIINGIKSAFSATYKLAQAAVKGTKAGQKSHSPSKLAGKEGDNYDLGYYNHILAGQKAIYKAGYGVPTAALKGTADAIKSLNMDKAVSALSIPVASPKLNINTGAIAQSIGNEVANAVTVPIAAASANNVNIPSQIKIVSEIGGVKVAEQIVKLYDSGKKVKGN